MIAVLARFDNSMYTMSSSSGHSIPFMASSRDRLDTASLRQHIGRDVFEYQILMDCLSYLSKPRDKVSRLLAAGDIIRVRKGLYLFAERFRGAPICRELLANLIHGPSYVSLDYALSFHGLIPERVEEITSVCTGRSCRFDTPAGVFSYRSLSIDRYSWGAELMIVSGSSFLMAKPAKALADKVWTDKRFTGARLSDFGPYLFQDLRIDPGQLGSIPARDFIEAAEAYRSPKIQSLAKYIASLQERPDA